MFLFIFTRIFSSLAHLSFNKRRVIPSFSLSPLKPPGCSGELAHHPVPFTLFFYLRVFRHPSLAPALSCLSLLNYPSARSWRAKLGCGRRSRDTTPHHDTSEAVKNSSACQAWNFDIKENGRRDATAVSPGSRTTMRSWSTNCTHARTHIRQWRSIHACFSLWLQN